MIIKVHPSRPIGLKSSQLDRKHRMTRFGVINIYVVSAGFLLKQKVTFEVEKFGTIPIASQEFIPRSEAKSFNELYINSSECT